MPFLPSAAREFAQVSLGDLRLERRAQSLASTLSRHPSASFPCALGNEATLEAFYRFVGNDSVSPDALLSPHQSRSFSRAAARGGPVVVLHDTSEFKYEGEAAREGMGRHGDTHSFFGHYALAVGEGEAPVVHGVVGSEAYVIHSRRWFLATAEQQLLELYRGSERWASLAQRVRRDAPEEVDLIHVMDREGDDYAVWVDLLEQGDDFVIRSLHNRREEGGEERLDALLGHEDFVVSRSVPLSRRGRRAPPRSQKSNPPRDRRIARLSLRAREVEVSPPHRLAAIGESSAVVSVVEVVELKPPDGEKPVHWRIVSTLPCDTAEQVVRIVDLYRKRWLIEEFFKALKTGCAAEKRQARSLWTMLNVIALLVPIAWRLLVLRNLAHHAPSSPLSQALDAVELEVLRHLDDRGKLGDNPELRDGLLAIAAIGGHKKSNGEPGWLVLGRGLERLLDTAVGWRAAIQALAGGGTAADL